MPSNYRDTLDELFVSKLGFEFSGVALPIPEIPGKENIINVSKEYSANGIDVIVTECKDRIPEFQKQVIKAHKRLFPNSHFLFISNHGKVFDVYNVSTSKRLKPITYNEIERNTRLFKEKIQLFNVDESHGTVDLKIRIEKAFDTNDRVSKKFFDRFEKIHKKLQSAITGIKDEADISWYASVLLNRIMFIYFLQKHNVIQNDQNFLLTKFAEVEKKDEDYYKDFLLPLFFVGFAKRDKQSDKKAFTQKFGAVRYLNGGLFYPHHIEEKYSKLKVYKEEKGKIVPEIVEPEIEVDSGILKEILEFLNGYTWYLDSRPMKDESDINPDVLGYIFEKYINQKELGAYYTKEDITDYIARNTIIPFILDKLRNNGHNAPDPYPLITENKDIKQAISDYIENISDYKTLKFLYKDILLPLSVLDPAVGSGAFLFAALNILLPVYQKTVFKLKQFRLKHKDEWLKNLCSTLELHSEEYYLTKQIILNNLFGVDIVEEATEICKLRLFLQLASHLPDIQAIEPLPDIDFNIYSGNSLVGGLSWEDLQGNYGMKLFDKQGQKLNLEQIKIDITSLSSKKQEYRNKQQEDIEETDLKVLKNEINKLELKINNNIDIGITNPFHWFIEYNDIILKGGFDVIIGNPPYLELNDVEYKIKTGYRTILSGAIHAMFIERAMKLLVSSGTASMILPLSIVSTQRMKIVQEILSDKGNVWYSNFAWRPGKLFDKVNRALTIFITSNSSKKKVYSTGYQKWNAENREGLLDRMSYVDVTGFTDSYWIPKFSNNIERDVMKKYLASKRKLLQLVKHNGSKVYYKSTGGLYWKVFTDFQPKYSLNGEEGNSSRETFFCLQKEEFVYSVIALLSSNLFWWWYTISSNLRDNNPSDIYNFILPENIENDNKLIRLGRKYLHDIDANSYMMTRLRKKTNDKSITQSFEIKKSKRIIDEIDILIAPYFGFTNDEVNFIINYDLNFRMSNEEE